MVTTHDDDVLRSHEEAAACLRYAVPGAHVDIYRPPLRHIGQRNSERSMAYQIIVRRSGCEDVCVLGSYSLPCEAAPLATHAREQVAKATRE